MRLKENSASAVFVLIEAALLVLIQTTQGVPCRALSYTSVLLALIHAIYVYMKCARGAATVAALFFTALADYFLVVMQDGPKVLAMVFFSGAQLAYAVRIAKVSGRVKQHVIIRIASVALLEVVMLAVLKTSADALAAITMFYFANLAVSLVLAFLEGERMLASGLVFFILCDVFVGLGVLATDYFSAEHGSVLYALTHTGIDLVWLFYVPSQTLISLSELKRKERREL